MSDVDVFPLADWELFRVEFEFSSFDSDKLNGPADPVACLRSTDVVAGETTWPMF